MASTHGGNIEYILEIIKKSEPLINCGIKFQVLKPDLLADKNYKGFQTYQKLYFNEKDWNQIIKKASNTKNVWIDVFDDYSIQVVHDNIQNIEGVKLQASLLENEFVIEKIISLCNSKELKFILNISGFDINQIKNILHKFVTVDNSKIYLQVGFQSHPTDFNNSCLNKLQYLKKVFPEHKISFTDHLPTDSSEVLTLPLIASTLGAEIIEKHIYLKERETLYDFYSSIDINTAKLLNDKIIDYNKLLKDDKFISNKEKDYLEKSYLYPQLKSNKSDGEQLSMQDLNFKRTSGKGLKVSEFNELINKNYLLSKNLKEGSLIKREHFKKARIGAVVVCRMKSSRLKNKALLKIGKLTSIEYCIKNILEFDNIDKVILATSDHKDDKILENYTYNDNVGFYQGDQKDVIRRILDVSKNHDLDIVVRITGDSPLRSKKIYKTLLKSHFKKSADYTAAENVPIGTNIEIINVKSLEKLFKIFNKSTPYSEYLSYYFKNNPKLFKNNIIKFNETINPDLRLTLDYKEDLELLNVIENKFKFCENQFEVDKVFNFLNDNKDIQKINSNCKIQYSENSQLLEKINQKTKIK